MVLENKQWNWPSDFHDVYFMGFRRFGFYNGNSNFYISNNFLLASLKIFIKNCPKYKEELRKTQTYESNEISV